MGQRHQIFVIAKIGTRYRGLAAVHHQWLYGFSAIQTCLNLMKIFQCPANRWALKHELRSATHLDEEYWTQDGAFGFAPHYVTPFPFITTCLTVGSSLRPDDAYHYETHVLGFNTSYDGGDNNNGITVLDITDLEKVRYCFVDFNGMESEGEVELMAPLSASTYLEAYGIDKGEAYKTLPLIDGRALNSAWPSDDWIVEFIDDEGNSQWDEVRNLDAEKLSIEGLGPTLGQLQLGLSTRGTLRSSTLAQTIQAAFESPELDLPEILESASLLGDFFPKVKAKACDDPTIITQSVSARRLLSIALKNDTSIDLSPFSDLNPIQIMDILKGRSANPEGLVILDLSGNQNLTEEAIKEILNTFPGLKTLRLLGTPQIPLDKKIQLFQGKTTQLLDSEQFALPFSAGKDNDVYAKPVPREKSLYGYMKPIIRQVLILSCAYDPPRFRDKDGRINMEAVLDKHEKNAHRWTCIPLEEVNLAPPLLMSALTQYLGFLLCQRATHDLGTIDPPVINLAKQVAMPSALDGTENSAQIYPMCEYFYKSPRDSWSLSKGGWWKHCAKIEPGEWTMVLLGDNHKGGQGDGAMDVRYAFVTADGPVQPQKSSDGNSSLSNLVVETIEGFLERQTFSATDRDLILRVWATATKPAKQKGDASVLCKVELESIIRALVYPEATDNSD